MAVKNYFLKLLYLICEMPLKVNYFADDKGESLICSFYRSRDDRLLIWMFCHKTIYLKMQRIHHKTLKVIYMPDTFHDALLQWSNSVSLRQRHLQFLMMKIHKSIGTLNYQCMSSYFRYREVPHDLRWGPVLFIPPTRSTIFGTNSVYFLGSLIWNKLHNLIKSSRSISEFWLLARKSEILEILTVGKWCVEGSTLWANFLIILVLLCLL